MKQTKQTTITEPTAKAQPTTSALEKLAAMPEDVQKMALGFAYGLEASKRKAV